MHSRRSIAAVVIAYHPPAHFLQNVLSYAAFVDVVYVFDNSTPAAELQALCHNSNIKLITNSDNLGIAVNLNRAARMAIDAGYQWLLTMDQDSSFSTGMFDAFLNCAYNYPDRENVALFGPSYEQVMQCTTCTPVVVTNLITSGSLLRLQHYSVIGDFDENLFIDSVDFDYTVRARLKGLSLIRFDNIFLQHNLGTTVHRSAVKSLYLKKKKKTVHNPLRCYYMYRNMLYLSKKLGTAAPEAVRDLRSTVKGILKANFFYGRFATEMMGYLIKAKRDYAAGRMGRIQGVSYQYQSQ